MCGKNVDEANLRTKPLKYASNWGLPRKSPKMLMIVMFLNLNQEFTIVTRNKVSDVQ